MTGQGNRVIMTLAVVSSFICNILYARVGVEKGNVPTLLLRMCTGIATIQNSMEAP